MRVIWIQMLIEMRSLRINKFSTAVSFLVLPLTYTLVALLAQTAGTTSVSYLASGSLVASVMSILFGLTLVRTSNLFQPQVLELHATFPISKAQLMIAAWLSHLCLAAPLVGVLFVLSVAASPDAQTAMALVGLLTTCLMVSALAAGLGLLLRNPYKAQGVMALASWALVFLSPMHQNVSDLPCYARGLLLVNPVTHALNMLRPFLGFEAVAAPALSFIYATVVILAILPFLRRACQRVTMLEKFF